MDKPSSCEQKELTFNTLDQISIGFSEGLFRADAPPPFRFILSRLAPLMEFVHLVEGGVLPEPMNSLIEFGELADFRVRLLQNRRDWEAGSPTRFGLLRLADVYDDEQEARWAAFSVRAKHAAETLFPSSLAGQLVGAVMELHSNIFDHSGSSCTGLIAFAAHPNSFEAVVADKGVGVFESLRSNPVHASLRSHGEALRLALEPGVSRHPDGALHGHGFDRMFTGLLNCNCSLRFRSGTGAIEIDGRGTGNPTPIVTERPCIPGFIISIECHR
jgi:hypothetical protein